ncbi:hypothetical protein [Sphingomonas sp.]|uniref:hypothetical protein n=1 Tax=Sphingomonas sp. TaxID=28214 RepID=UPI002EDB95C4
MNDFFGRPLAIGDQVAFIETGYRNFKKATVADMTPQKVRLIFRSQYAHRADESTMRFPSEVVKQ